MSKVAKLSICHSIMCVTTTGESCTSPLPAHQSPYLLLKNQAPLLAYHPVKSASLVRWMIYLLMARTRMSHMCLIKPKQATLAAIQFAQLITVFCLNDASTVESHIIVMKDGVQVHLLKMRYNIGAQHFVSVSTTIQDTRTITRSVEKCR